MRVITWPMIALRSLWLGGAARPVAGAADDDASVGPITEGAKPVASAAGPITEGAKRRMSQSSLSACLHRRRFSLALIVALRLIVSSAIVARHLRNLSLFDSELQALRRPQSSPASGSTRD